MSIDLKRLIPATLLGGLGMWIIAGIWHNLIMPSLYEHVHARHEGLGILLVAYFVLALLMAYVYPLGYKGGKPVIAERRFRRLR